MSEVTLEEEVYEKRTVASRTRGFWLTEFILSTGIVKTTRGAYILLVLFLIVAGAASFYISSQVFTTPLGAVTSGELFRQVGAIKQP